MGLNWNEIKFRGLLYSKNSFASDAERVAFLFELYQRITSLLPAPSAKKARSDHLFQTLKHH
jgi:hypothetical protein